MRHFLIVTDTGDHFSNLMAGLNSRAEAEIHWAASADAALQAIKEKTPDLMIIDENVKEVSGLELARMVVIKNAMIHLAVVSSLSAEEFHEAGEGLGIMAHLPPEPGAGEAEKLLEALAKMP
ncbi:MAG: response regulator [Desulfococcaceae bacterium]|jgi:DNA-binding response OmpR family regulator|nr:response regulator [Desulfococcaceae bacterium]